MAESKNGATMAYRRFREKFKSHRERAGMTQYELAMAIGVAPPMVSFYESGKRRPSKIVLVQIREALMLEDSEFIELIYLATGSSYREKPHV